MLTGSTSTEEQNRAYRQMEQGANGGGNEIRVCACDVSGSGTDPTAVLRDCECVTCPATKREAREDRQIEAFHVNS